MFKYIPIHDGVNLQFRAEAFNLFNTPTFSQPGATVSFDANGVGQLGNGAGGISSTTAASSPRQIQLALKLIF